MLQDNSDISKRAEEVLLMFTSAENEDDAFKCFLDFVKQFSNDYQLLENAYLTRREYTDANTMFKKSQITLDQYRTVRNNIHSFFINTVITISNPRMAA